MNNAEQLALELKLLHKDTMSESTTKQYIECMDWINKHLTPTETVSQTSPNCYALKHAMEADIDLYVTNNVFKLALIESGYKTRLSDIKGLHITNNNVQFNVSKKDPIVNIYLKEGLSGVQKYKQNLEAIQNGR